MESKDLLNYKFNSVLNENEPSFSTISITTTTIAPKTKITFLKNGGDIINITPPINNYHELVFIILSDINFQVGGNLKKEGGFVAGSPALLFYNPSDKMYYYITPPTALIIIG